MKEHAHVPKKKGPKNRLNQVYNKITHSTRIQIIYMRTVHQASLNQIASDLQIKYNSIRNILKAYDSSGRTNRKQYYKANRVQKSLARKAELLQKKQLRRSAASTAPGTRQNSDKQIVVERSGPWKDASSPKSGQVSEADWCQNRRVEIRESSKIPHRPIIQVLGGQGKVAIHFGKPEELEFESEADSSPTFAPAGRLRLNSLKDTLQPAQKLSRSENPRKKCSLQLYVCQGPSNAGLETEAGLRHSAEGDYEQLFTFKKNEYPYQRHTDQFKEGREPSEDDFTVEKINEDVQQYENCKTHNRLFTGALAYLNPLAAASERSQRTLAQYQMPDSQASSQREFQPPVPALRGPNRSSAS